MTFWVDFALFCVVAGGALTDARTGRIPNALTLSSLVIAPLLHWLTGGAGAAVTSLAGAVLCGFPPLIVHRAGGMGGGDVKLFAALGAIAGPNRGLEIQFTAYVITTLFALVLCARRGQLRRLMRGAAGVLRRERIPSSPLLELRLGVFVLLGAVLVVVREAPWS